MQRKKINITDILTEIVKEITIKSGSFSHIETDKLIICLGSNKNNGRGCIYGKLVPFKFKNGSDVLSFRGRYYSMPQIMHNGVPLLYAIYFYLPKFFDLPAKEKLNVIFHELFHISPKFNGDIRRMGKVKKAHGSSKKRFDALFVKEVNKFYDILTGTPYIDFLNMDSRSLERDYVIYARRMKMPRPAIMKKDIDDASCG